MSAATQTVHVRVNDAATGRPTPCRVHFSMSEAQEYVAPLGRLTDFRTGPNEDVGGNLSLVSDLGNRYAYTDGTCEIELSSETPIWVELHKGPEYFPLCQEVSLGPGQMALRFNLERWIDLRREGWYSGDIRAYCLSPHGALLEAAAEDLAVVNLLACDEFRATSAEDNPRGIEPQLPPKYYRTIPNMPAFSGQKAALEMPGHLIVVNTHNNHPILGSLALLNCHRAVYPLSFGGPDELDDWTLADWCDQCHRKNGLVVWTRMLFPPRESASQYGEALADLVLGKIDACDRALDEWYQLLACGFRLPAVAGSAKCSNDQLLGEWRTYARLGPGEELTYPNWIEAVRAGRTFITSMPLGPLLRFEVNHQGPGAVLHLPGRVHPVHVRAECPNVPAYGKLRVLANGQVTAESGFGETTRAEVIEAEVTLPSGGWLLADCWGNRLPNRGPVTAVTSPVYIQVEGQTPPVDPAALRALIDDLDRTLAWVHHQARCENDRQRQRLADIFHSARQELLRRLGG